ncbi:MAG TPA: class I SAM-dependent methyltransferase [Acidimicrobiia bacterium]
MPACCDPKAYGSVFDERDARRNAANFRRKGLGSTAAEMVRALAERGLAGTTVLEVGAGSGSAQVALLEAGAARGVAFDLSPASEAVAAELLAERGLAGRVEWHTADFVAVGPAVAAADIVFLNKVVCCYPDMPALIDAAVGHARRFVAVALPRRRLFVRAGIRLINGFLRLRRTTFRVFSHDPGEVARRVEAEGLGEVASGTTAFWEWHLWERKPA